MSTGTGPRSTICLSMIVKDEAPVLARCLARVRPLLDAWLIVDTGSTDETQQIVREALADLPGALHERPWRSFGDNRTEAFELTKGRADYALFIDADDALVFPVGFRFGALVADAIHLPVFDATLRYHRAHLAKLSKPFFFRGVVHEHLASDVPFTTAVVDDVQYHRGFDGARSRDPRKYAKDAEALERALLDAPNDTRTVFYLAQSYRDAGDLARAELQYLRRASMGGWDEEVWYSLLEVARLRERQRRPIDDVVAAYLRAHQTRPSRAEALVDAARFCRANQQWALAHLFADAATRIPPTADALFVDPSATAWRALDEASIASFYLGRHAEAIALAMRLLTEGNLPIHEVERVRANLAYSVDAMRGAGVSAG